MSDSIDRWSAFTDKELNLIEQCLADSPSSGNHYSHAMISEITVEKDRRRRADAADKPRASFERTPEIDKDAIRKVADELWDLGDKGRSSRIHNAFGLTPPLGEITHWKG